MWKAIFDVLTPPLLVGAMVASASDSYTWGISAALALLFILDALYALKGN